MKIKLSREFLIGLIFVTVFAISIWGINFLKGKDIFQFSYTYYAKYDNIGGLNIANPIILNGFQIGQVDDIGFVTDKDHKIVVRLLLKKKVQIPTNSIAKIINSSFLGTKAIELILNDSIHTFYSEGDTLNSQLEVDLMNQIYAEVSPLKQKTENLLLSLDTLITEVFDKQARRNLSMVFENIEQTTRVLNEQRENLRSVLTNLESVSINLKNNNKAINSIIDNTSNITDSISKSQIKNTINNTNSTLEHTDSILKKINAGQGTLGLMVNDDSLYINLKNSTKSLNSLLEDLKSNPKNYVHFSVFGSKKKESKK